MGASGSAGIMTDGPGNYFDNEYCWWIIVANGANISLVISELYLESEYDWVRVYECAKNTCSTPDEFNLKRELTGVIPDLVEINVQNFYM
jgi:hypothetical protein